MSARRYIEAFFVLWPVAVGFVAGALIAYWIGGPDLDPVEMTLALVSAGIGAFTGLMASLGVRCESPRAALITTAGGIVACVLVGLVMIAYRWIFR